MNRFLQSVIIGAGLAMATTAVAQQDVYIVGTNVNGMEWYLSDPDAKMTEVSEGVYEWFGNVLGTGFKLNDGTWDGDLNMGSNGTDLELDLAYNLEPSGGNILFADNIKEVQNVGVVYEAATGIITVKGTPVYYEGERYLYVRGGFNNWDVSDDYKLVYDETSGLYTTDNLEIHSEWTQFKIADDDWSHIYGGTYDPEDVIFGDWMDLLASSNPGSLYGYFDGIYRFKFDKETAQLLIEETAGPSMNYSNFYFNVSTGGGEWEEHYFQSSGSSYDIIGLTLTRGTEFVLSSDYEGVFASPQMGAKITDDNLSCVLDHFAADAAVMRFSTVLDIDGAYDIHVEYQGSKAYVTFTQHPVHVDPEIDYSSFYFQWGNQNGEFLATPLVATEDPNVYKVSEVTLPVFFRYLLVSANNELFAADNSDNNTFEDNFTSQLDYFNGTQDWTPYYSAGGASGVYDVTVTFAGTTATLNFKRLRDVTLSSDKVVMIKDQSVLSPDKIDGNTLTFTDVYFSGNSGFYFYDLTSGREYGDPDGYIDPITPENLTAIVKPNAVYVVDVNGLTGAYDITVTFNEDFSEAEVTFTKVETPDEISQYEGDLYLTGSFNDWADGAPYFKMTCIEPGVYEWTGDITMTDPELKFEFKINAGNWNSYFPGTDTSIILGAVSNGELRLGTPFGLTFGGDNISVKGSPIAIKNAKVTLNLADMNLVMTGEAEYAPMNPEYFYFYTGEGHVYHADIISEDEIVYRNVDFTDDPLFVIQTPSGFFGATDPNEFRVASPDQAVTLYNSLYHNYEVYYSEVQFSGTYDVRVKLNADQTEAILTFESPDHGPSTLEVVIENGVSFKLNGEYGLTAGVTVSTNDEFWGISGYTFEDQTVTFNEPVPSFYEVFFFMGKEKVLCHTEYLGECEILGIDNSVAEFGNNVSIERTAEGVAIHNVEIGTDIVVYTAGGQVVKMTQADSTEMNIRLEPGQVYIVRAGQVAVKVM